MVDCMKRVIVTGGAGFIGKNTIQPLLERNYEVHIISSRPQDIAQKNIVFHRANLLDCSVHAELMKTIRPTHLLHSAWYTQNGKFWDAIENVYWLKASLSLIETFYHEGGERFVGVGTCAEYDWSEGLCIEGKTPEIPSTLYGKMKKATYDCLSALAHAQGKSFAWARLFFLYGEAEASARLVPHVITQLLQDKEAKCTHGNQVRDFMHVSDTGYALAAVLDTEVSGAINVASGKPVKIQEVVSQIASALNKESLVKFGAIPEPLHSPPLIVANIDRLKNEIGWSPQLSLDEGILRTIDWWREVAPIQI